jgi:hypothetical protein
MVGFLRECNNENDASVYGENAKEERNAVKDLSNVFRNCKWEFGISNWDSSYSICKIG